MWWSLAAATVASLTALVIAFFAYPWQKDRDRRLQVQAERRTAYREFFATLSKLYAAAGEGSNADFFDTASSSMHSFNAMILYAPEHVIDACKKAFVAVHELDGMIRESRTIGSDLTHEDLWKSDARLKELQVEALAHCRADLSGSSFENAKKLASRIITSSHRDAHLQEDKVPQ